MKLRTSRKVETRKDAKKSQKMTRRIYSDTGVFMDARAVSDRGMSSSARSSRELMKRPLEKSASLSLASREKSASSRASSSASSAESLRSLSGVKISAGSPASCASSAGSGMNSSTGFSGASASSPCGCFGLPKRKRWRFRFMRPRYRGPCVSRGFAEIKRVTQDIILRSPRHARGQTKNYPIFHRIFTFLHEQGARVFPRTRAFSMIFRIAR